MATDHSTESLYREFKRLDRFDSPGLQPVSTFSRTRIKLNCARMLMDYDLYGLSDDAFTLFWRLMPYAPWGVPSEPDRIGIMARWSTRKVKRVWPEIEPFFVMAHDGNWRLAEREWVKPYMVPLEPDRVPLRRFFSRLVEYWGRACVYCGTAAERLAIEHIVPLARGGKNDIKNLTLACKVCNSRKGTQTAAEFGHPHIHDRAARIR